MIAYLEQKDFILPANAVHCMRAADLETIIEDPLSCLQAHEWDPCPKSLRRSKSILLWAIHKVFSERPSDFWVTNARKLPARYLLDTLHSVYPAHPFFYQKPYTSTPRRLKRQRKHPLPQNLPVGVIAPASVIEDVNALFRMRGNYFKEVENFSEAQWNQYRLADPEVRLKILKKLGLVARLIKHIQNL